MILDFSARIIVHLILISAKKFIRFARCPLNDTFDVAFRAALRNVKKEYSKKGYQFPDTRQFGCDIDKMLNVDFWE